MARILLGWELGGGLGHAKRLLAVARALENAGHICIYATPNTLRLVKLNVSQNHLREIRQWPRVVKQRGATIAAASFGDLLAELVFADSSEMVEQAKQWRRLFAETRCDTLLADYAPGAVIAARGILPVLNMGDSYYLPPSELKSYPPYFAQKAKHAETAVVARVNEAFTTLGARRADTLPSCLATDAVAVTNFPTLDIFQALRLQPAIGPLDSLPGLAAGSPRSLFGYFRPGSELNTGLMKGLLAAGLPGRVVIPGFSRSFEPGKLVSPLQFTSALADLNTAFNEAAVFVSHGGAQTVAAALAAGVPQIVIASDDEKRLIGSCVKQSGAGISLLGRNLQSSDVARAIREVAQDQVLRKRTHALAKTCQAIAATDPMAKLTKMVSGLLKL